MTKLISDQYKEVLIQTHKDRPAWGGGNIIDLNDPKHRRNKDIDGFAKLLTNTWVSLGKGSVLDYGCGKGWLASYFPIPIQEYDPGIPGKDQLPEPANLVICTDVMEHLEPDYLDAVLEDLQRVTSRRAIFMIHCVLANTCLSDGRNTHLIVQDSDWWLRKLLDYFHIETASSASKRLLVLVKKLNDGTY